MSLAERKRVADRPVPYPRSWISNNGLVDGLGRTSINVIATKFEEKPRPHILVRNHIYYYVLSGFYTPDMVAMHVKLPERESEMEMMFDVLPRR